ncbi:hypothetical protein DL96DRAFT_587889 [Flagelloscypha sp. PMI_526]|nr:hypothetical protein DL96DRAFT_587889 [Flagelloscypha sp. PMI_526]
MRLSILLAHNPLCQTSMLLEFLPFLAAVIRCTSREHLSFSIVHLQRTCITMLVRTTRSRFILRSRACCSNPAQLHIPPTPPFRPNHICSLR